MYEMNEVNVIQGNVLACRMEAFLLHCAAAEGNPFNLITNFPEFNRLFPSLLRN